MGKIARARSRARPDAVTWRTRGYSMLCKGLMLAQSIAEKKLPMSRFRGHCLKVEVGEADAPKSEARVYRGI